MRRSPQGNRLSMHRRAPETVRNRRRDDSGTEKASGFIASWHAAKPEGRAPRLYRDSQQNPPGGGPRRETRRGDRPWYALYTDVRRRPRAAQSPSGRRTRRRLEADGDQAVASEGAPHHLAERSPVLAAGGKALNTRGHPRAARAAARFMCAP